MSSAPLLPPHIKCFSTATGLAINPFTPSLIHNIPFNLGVHLIYHHIEQKNTEE